MGGPERGLAGAQGQELAWGEGARLTTIIRPTKLRVYEID
jgi:hypothetical protein